MATVRDYTNYLVYLCRCAVKDEMPENGFSKELDFERFFQFCYDHQLVGLAYDMISKNKTGYEGTQTMLIFKDKHNYAVLKDASQEYYLSLIKEAFANNGIDYTLLKGSVIKNLYPIPYYRQCTDADILIRREDTERAKTVMEALGFENKTFGSEDHTDNYRIDKYMYVELHKNLVPKVYEQFRSCEEIPKRLILKGNHEYAMTDEDFYIFMVVHLAKHLKWSSAGIRAILDIWVYLKNKQELNWENINSELEKCELTKFHEKLMELVDYWFKCADPNKDILKMADYIGESGWNGSKEHTDAFDAKYLGAMNKSSSNMRLRYFLRIAFMDKANLRNRYPVLDKHPYLLPACWVHRGFEVLFKRRNMIDSVLHTYDDVDMNKSAQIDAMRKSFGL